MASCGDILTDLPAVWGPTPFDGPDRFVWNNTHVVGNVRMGAARAWGYMAAHARNAVRKVHPFIEQHWLDWVVESVDGRRPQLWDRLAEKYDGAASMVSTLRQRNR